MNPHFLKLLFVSLLLFPLWIVLFGTGCRKEPEPKPAPYKMSVAIYKTKNDYFNNVHTNLKDGNVYYIQSLRGKVEIEDDGTVRYKFRVKLVNDYILVAEHSIYAAFLSYTIDEYFRMQPNGELPTIEEITEHIIDRDPFLEYYIEESVHPYFNLKDTALINEIIRNNRLELYFKKIK